MLYLSLALPLKPEDVGRETGQEAALQEAAEGRLVGTVGVEAGEAGKTPGPWQQIPQSPQQLATDKLLIYVSSRKRRNLKTEYSGTET